MEATTAAPHSTLLFRIVGLGMHGLDRVAGGDGEIGQMKVLLCQVPRQDETPSHLQPGCDLK